MTKTLDVTRMGATQEICESVVTIPEILTKPSYLVRWGRTGNAYGRVYPTCKYADADVDGIGDFRCNHPKTPIIHCGCSEGECPLQMPYKSDPELMDGPIVEYIEYCNRVHI